MKIRLALGVDDIHPCDETSVPFLRQLFGEFPNLKVSLFVPFKIMGDEKCMVTSDWIDSIVDKLDKSLNRIEFCQHGYAHSYSHESAEEYRKENWKELFRKAYDGWVKLGVVPVTFKPPGWYVPDGFFDFVHEVAGGNSDVGVVTNRKGSFDIVKVGEVHDIPYNQSIEWLLAEVRDPVIIHSYNTGQGISNRWTPRALENVRGFLKRLEKYSDVDYCTFSELLL